MGLWTWIRGIGGNRDEQADLHEELGGQDPGEAEEKYLAESGFGSQGGGLAFGDAAEVAEADLEETKPPRDPAP
ncbi:MAG TPA: hypothetical protein VE688_00875 [Gaiellaceae bacterium]|jgi:hypothetical protein|nr:hypothetical protein [Gaiellaceae bacterium]